MTRLVDGDGMTLAFDELDLLVLADATQVSSLQHVGPGDDFTLLAHGDKNGLVDEVLDAGARRPGSHRRQTFDLRRW